MLILFLGNGYINLNTVVFANNTNDAYTVAHCDDSDDDHVEPSEGPREPVVHQINNNDNNDEGSGASGINGDINRSSDVSSESSRSLGHRGEDENSANSHDLRVSVKTALSFTVYIATCICRVREIYQAFVYYIYA